MHKYSRNQRTLLKKLHYRTANYLLKVKNRNTKTRCEICSELTIKTLERDANGVILGFVLLTLNIFQTLF